MKCNNYKIFINVYFCEKESIMKLRAKVNIQNTKNKFPMAGFIAKGTLIALSISLVLVLVFAFLLKFTNISDNAIAPVNQVIKGVSIFLGVFIGLRKCKELGLVSGLLIGFIYTLVAFLVFSILSGSFTFDLSLLTDAVFGAVIGAICGIISVNIKKSTN